MGERNRGFGCRTPTEAIALDPADVDPYLWRASAYGQIGRNEEALRDGDAALKLADSEKARAQIPEAIEEARKK